MSLMSKIRLDGWRFCTLRPSSSPRDDSYSPSRYNEQQLTQSLMSVIHETGHIPQKALASHYPLFY